jgi:hypothetical protein
MKDWRDFYRDIPMSEDEKAEAIFEGQKRKYFREKNADYWNEKEQNSVGKKRDSHREIE